MDNLLYYFPLKIVKFLRKQISIQKKSCSIPNIIHPVGLGVVKPIDLGIKMTDGVLCKHHSIEHLHGYICSIET